MVARIVGVQPVEIYVDDEAKLTLHGLVQHYIMLNEEEKNRKLNDLLDALDFNQVRPAHYKFCSNTFAEGLGVVRDVPITCGLQCHEPHQLSQHICGALLLQTRLQGLTDPEGCQC